MANQDRYTAAQVIDAIQGTGGVVAAIARKLGCRWSTAKKYLETYPTINRAWLDERESMIDSAETGLINAVEKEDPWAIKYTLSTLGKKRGFSERVEVSGEGGGPVVLKFTGNVDPDEL